ncbi:hypothetical protein L1987_22688 [Smallanthus sonchifolius]|uniref:Uncharacterized protein n=1 Tax=Smallanthus sonchifolius TaxID=185202 RepID=A0ACB9IGG4_9ASTR|nr:hypothetical protein L1987_22688 [Smallanthus sonchifolius]
MDSDSASLHIPPSPTHPITESISPLLNPNRLLQPTLFYPSLLNLVYNPTFTNFNEPQNQNLYLNPQPLVTSNANIGGKSTHHQVGASTNNPKKRTRASRRAPTTVLTTDTTNFRQMVQEFTGIPPAPLSRRLDVFSGGGRGPLYPTPPPPPQIPLQQNPIFSFQSLLQTKADNSQVDDLSGFPCSSTRWRDPHEDLMSFDRNTTKVDDQSDKGLDDGNQVQGNVWVCRYDG